jgi:nitrate reductase molybdenum cofactor assembly chaperone NarJ/NarW
MTKTAHTFRALARLLSYPDAELRGQLGGIAQALRDEGALSAARRSEIEALVRHLNRGAAMDVEAAYVELFDRGRGCALHLFEHVHGDSRERGGAMVALLQSYEQAGLELTRDELPDHLCVLLEYASTQPSAQAKALLREVAHILQVIHAALLKRGSAYAAALAALLDLAGETARATPLHDEPEPTLDESWAEPPVFGGCSRQGQAAPGEAHPIHIVRADGRPPKSTGAHA